MAFIVSLILDQMILDLQNALETEGIERANLVRRGPLQESPVDQIVSALVYENDPSDADGWAHVQGGLVELSGTSDYFRRFTVTLRLYLVDQGMSRLAAKEAIDNIHGRAIHALRESEALTGIQDEYGEIVQSCITGVVKSRMVLSGGPDTSWIGNGKIWFEVWTRIPGL